jgi:hypothetical protein
MSTKRYQRGIRAHVDLFGSELPESDQIKKGRNEKLNEQRYERLCDRYYYYAHLKKMARITLLQILEKEFDLSIDTIPRIIDERAVDIKRMMNAGVGVKELKKKYDWIVWE